MIRILFGLILPLLLFDPSGKFNFWGHPSDQADSLDIEIERLFDETGLPDGYKARVFTPICEEDKCYAVEIDFYWDLIGRYVRYDTIPGQPLTKLEHEPFTPEEYEKLDEILSNSSSVLANYKKEELVRDIEEEGVDGVSGATITEIRESVISGAVYSCYVLWHIVHGPVTESIRMKTLSDLSDSLVQKLVGQEDQEINYFLINNFTKPDFIEYMEHVLATIEKGQGYYPKNAIEKMPTSVFADERAQGFFARRFDKLNYFTQIALLKKLEPAFVNDELKISLKAQLDGRNSQKNDLINHLIGGNNNP